LTPDVKKIRIYVCGIVFIALVHPCHILIDAKKCMFIDKNATIRDLWKFF